MHKKEIIRQNEVIVFPNLQLRVHSLLKVHSQPLQYPQNLPHLQRLQQSQPRQYTRIQMNYIKRELVWGLGWDYKVFTINK